MSRTVRSGALGVAAATLVSVLSVTVYRALASEAPQSPAEKPVWTQVTFAPYGGLKGRAPDQRS